MSLIRPDLARRMHRWREVLLAGAVAACGLWLALSGGWLLLAVGAVLGGAGLASAVVGLRRLRFGQTGAAPGVVDIDEGQLTYFGPPDGPFVGGFLALRETAELALVTQAGLRCWRLTAPGGTALWVPVAAEGADQLFDAFAGLPGIDMPVLLSALQHAGAPDRIIWRRSARLLPG